MAALCYQFSKLKVKLVKNFHYHQYYITCAFHNQLSVVEVCLFVSGWVPVQYVREEVRVINYNIL